MVSVFISCFSVFRFWEGNNENRKYKPNRPLELCVDGCFFEMVETRELWIGADAVCFDVDSSVCLDEGIDELAEFCGAVKAVAEWTARLDFFFY